MQASAAEERADLLRRVDVLATLDRVALARLVSHIEPQLTSAGTTVCRENEAADSLYIVSSGRFGVFTAGDDGTERRINTIDAGGYFGETALLTDETRSATVRADTDGEVLRLERNAFLRLLDEDAHAARAVAASLARRLRHRDHLAVPERPAPATVEAALQGRHATIGRRGRATTTIGVLIALGLSLAAFFAVDLAQWRFSLFLFAAIALWVTEPVPAYVVSLGLVIAWVVTGIVPPYNAVLGFASTTWVFVFSVLGMASIVARSGLLLRVGLLLIERVPASVRWQSAAFVVTGIALTPLLPLAMARSAVMAPLAVAVADALRLRERDAASTVLGLSAWVGAGPFMFLFLNGSPVCILAWSLMPTVAKVQFTWGFWFVSALPLAALIAGGMVVALQLLERPAPVSAPSREPVLLQKAVLGPMSGTERAVAVIVAATLVAWIVGPRFVLDAGLIALASFLVLTIVTRSRASDLGRLDWAYLLFLGVAFSLSNITTGLRLDRMVGEAVAPRLSEFGIVGAPYLLLVALTTVAVRSVLPADQAILLLSLAFVPVATALNVHPWLAVITILTLGLMWHVPAQTPEYLVAHAASEGRLYTHRAAQRAAAAYFVVALAALMICLGYWHLLGLI